MKDRPSQDHQSQHYYRNFALTWFSFAVWIISLPTGVWGQAGGTAPAATPPPAPLTDRQWDNKDGNQAQPQFEVSMQAGTATDRNAESLNVWWFNGQKVMFYNSFNPTGSLPVDFTVGTITVSGLDPKEQHDVKATVAAGDDKVRLDAFQAISQDTGAPLPNGPYDHYAATIHALASSQERLDTDVRVFVDGKPKDLKTEVLTFGPLVFDLRYAKDSIDQTWGYASQYAYDMTDQFGRKNIPGVIPWHSERVFRRNTQTGQDEAVITQAYPSLEHPTSNWPAELGESGFVNAGQIFGYIHGAYYATANPKAGANVPEKSTLVCFYPKRILVGTVRSTAGIHGQL